MTNKPFIVFRELLQKISWNLKVCIKKYSNGQQKANYRSQQNILDAAQAVINNNQFSLAKRFPYLAQPLEAQRSEFPWSLCSWLCFKAQAQSFILLLNRSKLPWQKARQHTKLLYFSAQTKELVI